MTRDLQRGCGSGGPSAPSVPHADRLAAHLLGGLRTKLGGLHIDHARRVAGAVAPLGDVRAVVAALLHDVIEKTDITASELHELLGDPVVVAIVEVLTQHAGEPDAEYLARCAAHPLALVIKRSDLADKLMADDVRVGAAAADSIRRLARERLALLARLAQQTGTSPAPEPAVT